MNKEFYIVDENIFKLYTASYEARNLLNETKRKIKTESTSWSQKNPLTLKDIVLQVMANHFIDFAEYFHSDLLSDKCRYKLQQILPTNLPLKLMSKIIPDGIFWERAYHEIWKPENVNEKKARSWKNAYMQKYLKNYIEHLYPNDINHDEIEQLIELVREYVLRLDIDQLLTFDNAENADAELQHVDFRLMLPFLTKLESLSIKSGIKNIALRFAENLFELTTADCINIAESLRSLKSLKRIKLNSSNLNKCKVQPILLSLATLPFLQIVDFSSNDLSDDCFEEIANILTKVQTLEKIILTNNKIGPRGAKHLATVLHKYKSLAYLDLRLNFICDTGATELFEAVSQHPSLKTLILASCKLNSSSVPSLCDLVTTNKCIQEIDLNCNNLGESGGNALINAIQKNNSLQRLSLKMNSITVDQNEAIHQKLTTNRKISRAAAKIK